MIESPKPWISKGNLNRIGEKLRSKIHLTLDEYLAFNQWRASHFHVMNGFQAMLRARTRGNNIVVAQRHKRRVTIIDKLQREPKMQLSRMDDIAGIRIIFEDILKLNSFRDKFLLSRHKHVLKSDVDKYNYIISPKISGYRGIHDIYSYYSKSKSSSTANGLMIEVQYRTKYQHAWATANEIITMTTQNRTKFSSGDPKYLEFFRLVSELFSRVYEGMNSIYPSISNSELLMQLRKTDSDIGIIRFLESLQAAYKHVEFRNSVILHFKSEELNIIPIPIFKSAQELYFKIEKDNPNDDVVLVLSETFDQIRSAYRNYFSDSQEFINLYKGALEILPDL